jgi:hypothetical protein
MHIKHSKDDGISDKNTKQVHFRDIKDVRLPSEEIEKQIKSKDSLVNWQFPFFVDTGERPFQLYTQSEPERRMWVAGFEYLCKSTREV